MLGNCCSCITIGSTDSLDADVSSSGKDEGMSGMSTATFGSIYERRCPNPRSWKRRREIVVGPSRSTPRRYDPVCGSAEVDKLKDLEVLRNNFAQGVLLPNGMIKRDYRAH